MRALILSDIHANLPALNAVLDAAPAYDVVWNLGDIVGYGASPNEVIAQVQQLGKVFVRGNHDRACCGLAALEDFNPMARRAAEWTSEELTPQHLEWLLALPTGPLKVSPDLICVHGSAAEEDEYVHAMPEALNAWMAAPDEWIQCFGHTHLQGGFARTDEDFFQFAPEYGMQPEVETFDLPLRRGIRYLLNPGSVGQPRDGDWRAAFALYDDVAALVRFYRAPYAIQHAQRAILDAGLPDRLASRLAEGR
jgi:predicted phosphodiesterase